MEELEVIAEDFGVDAAALDVDHLAVDVIGVIGGKVSHHRRDVFRPAILQREIVLLFGQQTRFEFAAAVFFHFRGQRHACVGRGADRVRRDAVFVSLFGNRAGETNDAGLGRTVVALSDGAFERIR